MSILIVAEAGSNHMGDLKTALNLIDTAAEAGADCVKFQMFRADSLYEPGPLRESARQWELNAAWLPILSGYATGCGIEFMCSAFSKDTIDMVDPYVKRHKIASLEASDSELVLHAASKGKPLIISTGTLNEREIFEIDQMLYGMNIDLTFLHCVAAYPAPLEDANMSAMDPGVGFSDHSTHPTLLPVMAVRGGATVIEKHLRLYETPKNAPDFPHSLVPHDFREMVAQVRLAESAMGDGMKRPMASERALMYLKRKPGKLRGEA